MGDQKGMTLIELLLAIALAGLIGLAIFQSLQTGFDSASRQDRDAALRVENRAAAQRFLREIQTEGHRLDVAEGVLIHRGENGVEDWRVHVNGKGQLVKRQGSSEEIIAHWVTAARFVKTTQDIGGKTVPAIDVQIDFVDGESHQSLQALIIGRVHQAGAGVAVGLAVEPSRHTFTTTDDVLSLTPLVIYSDGTAAGAPLADCAYEALTEGVVTMDGYGFVTPVANGTTGIRVRYGPFVAETTMTVALDYTKLEVVPTARYFTSLSQKQQLTVIFHDEEGVQKDVTGEAEFSSLDITVAQVSPGGQITPAGRGSTMVFAFYQGRSAPVAVTVDASLPSAKAEDYMIFSGQRFVVDGSGGSIKGDVILLGSYSTNFDKIAIDGIAYVDGDLVMKNNHFYGDVYVKGNVIVDNNSQVDGTLFHSGTLSNGDRLTGNHVQGPVELPLIPMPLYLPSYPNYLSSFSAGDDNSNKKYYLNGNQPYLIQGDVEDRVTLVMGPAFSDLITLKQAHYTRSVIFAPNGIVSVENDSYFSGMIIAKEVRLKNSEVEYLSIPNPPFKYQ